MNLTQITQQLGAPTEPSGGGIVIGFVVFVSLLALAMTSTWFGKKSRRPVAATILITVIAAALTGSIVFAVQDNARVSSEQSAWDEKAAGWAAIRYGVDAGMAGLGRVSVFQAMFNPTACPTNDRCYSGTVLIGDTLTPVTLVIIEETPILVSDGEGDSQRELTIISGVPATTEPGA